MEREILLIDVKNGSARPCRLLRCRPESSALILFRGSELFLLGDVRRLAPEFPFTLEDEEAKLLDITPDAPVDVFCRVVIPQHKPQTAGFTLEKLLIVAKSGRALEVRRSEGQLLSFVRR